MHKLVLNLLIICIWRTKVFLVRK